MRDLRTLALETARELERRSMQFPPGEPGRQWLRAMATRLKNSYARTRGQQKILILRAIADGCRRSSDFVDELGFSRREVCTMLAELIEDGYVAERSVPTCGGRGGRPSRWFELTDKAETLPLRKAE